MRFWEKCLYRTHHAFTHGYVAGRESFFWWLKEVDGRSLLPWDELGGGALCTIALVTKDAPAFRSAALSRLSSGRFKIGAELLSFQRPRLDDLITAACMDRDDRVASQLALAAIQELYEELLTQFVARFYVIDMPPDVVPDVIATAYRRWDWLGSRSFAAELWHWLIAKMPRSHPTAMPTIEPQWFGKLGADEKTFLHRSLVLDRKLRLVLFATLYGDATPADLAATMYNSGKPWSPKDMERLLIRAWQQLFDVL